MQAGGLEPFAGPPCPYTPTASDLPKCLVYVPNDRVPDIFILREPEILHFAYLTIVGGPYSIAPGWKLNIEPWPFGIGADDLVTLVVGLWVLGSFGFDYHVESNFSRLAPEITQIVFIREFADFRVGTGFGDQTPTFFHDDSRELSYSMP